MKRTLLGSILFVLLLCRAATAQEPTRAFGNKGVIMISAERLFGFDRASTTTTAAGMTATQNGTTFSFFGNPVAGLTTLFGAPRVAFDGFVADRVSVGGSATYFHASVSPEGPTSTTFSGFLVAPRVGFAVQLSPRTHLWPRLGVTYMSVDSGGSTASMLAASLDVPLAFVVAEHFVLLVGPTLDYGVTGKRESTGFPPAMNIDWTGWEVGVQCGLGGYF